MEAKDAQGNVLAVGDEVDVLARITSMVQTGTDVMLSAVTVLPHGEDGKVYSIPVIHGSQVTKT